VGSFLLHGCGSNEMSKNDLVSIIVPVYNVELYLHQCIHSILNQTYPHFELILVDDGSKDNSGNLCDEFAKVDPRIHTVHKTNGGLSSARNAGLEISTGSFIAYVDSDDWLEPRFLEVLVNAAYDTRADIVVCGYYQANEKGDKKRMPTSVSFVQKTYTGQQVAKQFLLPLFGGSSDPSEVQGFETPSVWKRLYRTSTVQECRFQSEREYLAEDLLYSLDVFSRSGRVTVCGYYGYNYRYNPQSLDRGFRPNRWELYKNLIQYLQRRIPQDCPEEYGNRLYRRYAESVVFSIWNLFLKDNTQAFRIQRLEFLRISKDVNSFLQSFPYRTTLPRNFRLNFSLVRLGMFYTMYVLRTMYVQIRKLI